jgi:imidazolonepropionase-like amidohydrolase
VREHIRQGVDWIKIIGVTGGMATPGQDPGAAQYRPEEIAAAIEEAHRWDRHVACHAHGAEGIANALDAGIDTIEHGIFLTDELARRIANDGVVFVPTLSNSFHTRRLEKEGRLPEAAIARRRELEAKGIVVPGIEQRMTHCREHGVVVATGTDSGGNAQVLHGNNGSELVMFVECGYTPLEAILAATGVAAKAMRIDHMTGSLSRRKQADVAAFAGNPLDDITVLSAVHGGRPSLVMKGGQIALRQDQTFILTTLGSNAAAAHPFTPPVTIGSSRWRTWRRMFSWTIVSQKASTVARFFGCWVSPAAHSSFRVPSPAVAARITRPPVVRPAPARRQVARGRAARRPHPAAAR